MKRLTLALLAVLSLAVGAAFASSGAEIYNSRCAMCHGADGMTANAASGNVTLKGQSADEIEDKLKGFVDGSYGGAKKKIMQRLAQKLSDEDLTAVSGYIGAL